MTMDVNAQDYTPLAQHGNDIIYGGVGTDKVFAGGGDDYVGLRLDTFGKRSRSNSQKELIMLSLPLHCRSFAGPWALASL